MCHFKMRPYGPERFGPSPRGGTRLAAYVPEALLVWEKLWRTRVVMHQRYRPMTAQITQLPSDWSFALRREGVIYDFL